MDYEKMRKNNILLPDLVIDNRVCKPTRDQELIVPKLGDDNHSPTADRQPSNISLEYLHENSPNRDSQPMSIPSSLPESASAEAIQNSDFTLDSQTIGPSQKLKRPSQYTGEIGELRSIFEIPPKYRSVFSNYPSFNVIQSKALDILLYTERPLVISAPTGSGKTVIFELAIINLLIRLNEMNYRGDYKIVYMAPVKALCTERYHDWQEKFFHLGLKCNEVTGDSYDSTIAELQNYNLVLTTPEKWDSLTRRWKQNKQLVQLVKLFLIDEVHLLSEEKRGPVLEAVVSRMKTIQKTLSYSKHSSAQNCEIQIPIRFIAVSATIPNIEDLADWLGDGLRPAESIKIGEEYRPVKLTKIVLGFPTSLKQNSYMFDLNLSYRLRDIIFKYAEGKPTLIFCSTRKGVTQTAQTLAKEITFHFSDTQKESLLLSSNDLVDKKLRETILSGVGSHHAGMDSNDRHITEDLFRRHLLPILVTTSTLAMGVNLPAHLVIVKSTQQYIGGIYQEYSETQMLQMIGRAGRPQFDKTATAIIMTRYQDKKRYERLVDGKDLIESTLHRHLAEHLNAEVVLETITDVCIAMNWLRSTFLYVRALKNPTHYGFAKGLSEKEITKKLQDLCLYEMNGLASANLVTMVNGLDIRPTEKGRLMASFYLSHETMKIFNKITGMESLNDMILIIASCHEFLDLQLRRVEKKVLNELNKIKDRECIRFPIKGLVRDIPMKVNVLTQATFGCLPINDHSLNQDSLKVMRVGERISRCLRKYLLNSGHYHTLLNSVLLAKCFYSKLWEDSVYVTKQLPRIGATYSKLLVSAGKTTFQSILVANPRDLERILNKAPPLGNELKKAVIHLPKYNLEINLNAMQNEGTMTLRLENLEDISEFSTAGLNHWLTIIVGDNTNKVIHNERLNDNQLIEMEGVVSWSFAIDSNANEIYGHAISDHWVGIDMNVTVPVKQNGSRPASTLMKKAIEQYVSKMGIPNPLVEKKAATQSTKPTKLTIVEQIRQKGRQLPDLGVKSGNLNVNVPTPMKQTSLDKFLYTPAKKLKLPSTYAQFINENASVGKVLNKHDFIQNLLPSIYNDEQCQIESNSVGKKANTQDFPNAECQPTTGNGEFDGEYGRTGERIQSSQEMYFQNSQDYELEQHEQYSNQNCYYTQEEDLDDMNPTIHNNQTNWEVGINQSRQLPKHNHTTVDSVIKHPRICDERSDYTVVISSDDDDELNWAKTNELEEREVIMSETRKQITRGVSNFTYGCEETSSETFPDLEKSQYMTPSKSCERLYSKTHQKHLRYLPSYIESDQEITMQPSNSAHLNDRGLTTQNCRRTLHYSSGNTERAKEQSALYSESQSEYLQRIKGHFADFKVTSNNEIASSFSKSHLGSFTKDPQPPTSNNERYGGHEALEKEYQSSQDYQKQCTDLFEDEVNGTFSVPFEESVYNMEQDASDDIYNSQHQYQVHDQGKKCLESERKSPDQDPMQNMQLQQETNCRVNMELLNQSCNEPSYKFTHELNNSASVSKQDYGCLTEQSQEDFRNFREEEVARHMIFSLPNQDHKKHPDVCVQETFRNRERYECGRGHESSNIRLQDQSCSDIKEFEHNGASDALHLLPASESVSDNVEIKNPSSDDFKINCSLEKQINEKVFEEKSEAHREFLNQNNLEEKDKSVNESETHCGKYDSNITLETQLMEQDELSKNTGILGNDQPEKKYNIPKHHFPIFISYDLNKDQIDLQDRQEKLHFKFPKNNCSSPEADNIEATPKKIFDSKNLGTRETNHQVPIPNCENTPKLAFDFDVDSLLDSIDSADISSNDSNQKCSQNKKEIPIKNQSNQSKSGTKRRTKKDWDKNDPLMVLFYGQRERKIDTPQPTDCRTTSENVAKPLEQADQAFDKPRTTNLQTVDHNTENKNVKPKELVNNKNFSSSKEKIVKPASFEVLFPYCKGREKYHPKVETKMSNSRISLTDISKAPKISNEIKSCQQIQKPEDFSIPDKPTSGQNQNSIAEKNLPQETLNLKNTKDSHQQQKLTLQNTPEICQQNSKQKRTLSDLPQPGIPNFNHREIAQNIKSSSDESLKSAATTACSNNEALQPQIIGRNRVETHKRDNIPTVLPAIEQHFQEQRRKSLPPTEVDITNEQTQPFGHLKKREHEYENKRIMYMPSNVPALRKVSRYEQVVRIQQANSSWKCDVNPSILPQQCQQLIRKSFHMEYQTSDRQEQLNESNNTTFPTQEGSFMLSSRTLTQGSSLPKQYAKQSDCSYDKPSDKQYPQIFNFQSIEASQLSKSGNGQLNYPSPEQIPDIISSASSKHSESEGNYFNDHRESKYKWLASQNTFTQRSEIDEDIFSSEDETREDSNQYHDDDPIGNLQSQNSPQCSLMPWDSGNDDYSFKKVNELTEQENLSESDIPFVSKKFEYNHTQTPRCIPTKNTCSSNEETYSRWEDVPYNTSNKYPVNRCYEKPATEKISYEICPADREELKYQSVFEQIQNNKFQVSPPREQHHGRSVSDLATSCTNVGRDSFCNRTKPSYPIPSEPRRDFMVLQSEDDKRSSNNQFHALYERDFDKDHKYSEDCMPQKMRLENYKQESASSGAARSEENVNFMNRQNEQPSFRDLSSETLSESRFHQSVAESFSSKTPQPIQRQNMFQYCQKRTPGIMDSEFSLPKTKHRRHF